MVTRMITTSAIDGNVIDAFDEESGKIGVLRHGGIHVWFEMVGPARAEELLNTYNVDYRKYRERYGDGLSRDMLNNNWNFDGSPVRIDELGNLFDAQHRLRAIIKSKTTQLFLFVGGLPVAAYNTTDTGLARQYNDSLRRRGFKNASTRQALVKLIERWENGRSLDDSRRLTMAEMDEIHEMYEKEITWAVAQTNSTSRKIDLPNALVAFSWFVLAQIDANDCKEFMVSLAEGEMLYRGHPIYTLRERLRRDKEAGYTRNENMHLVFAAWNAWRERNDSGNNGKPKSLERIPLPSGTVTRDKMANPR